MSGSDNIALLRAELAQDLEFIQENYDKNRRMSRRIDTTESPDEFDYAALGYTLHNLYNAFEAYFLRVAKFFENNLDESAWHKSLLDRMTLRVPGIRQAVVDRTLAERLRELMRFRHLFRNLYKSQLLPDKVTSANGYAEGIAAAFTEHHQRFDTFLAALADELRNQDAGK